MSDLISCQNLSKNFSSKRLFSNLTLSIKQNDKIVVLGKNGSGKSTLLKIFADLETGDTGQIAKKKNIRIAYISQSDSFLEGDSVESALARKIDLPQQPNQSIDIVRKIANTAGFSDLSQPVKMLSGGWKKRLAIAQGLIQEPDLFLLDEPTNHLDFSGLLWLESLLGRSTCAWVVITHDRYFLNRVAKTIWSLNPVYPGGILKVEGNYDQFKKVHQGHIVSLANREQTLKTQVKRESAWLHAGVKARTTKSRHRMEEAKNLIEELSKLQDKQKLTPLNLNLTATEKRSKNLVMLKGIEKSYSTNALFSGIDLVIQKGSFVGIIGENGSGKSTFLKIVAGKMKPDRGSITYSDQLKVVYFDQERKELNQQWTLARALSETGDSVVFQGRSIHIASWAKKFQFQYDQLESKIESLSGGEKARVLIARLMLKEADLLLLDEPTNDLDLETIEALEDSLKHFSGAAIIISHDRYFLELLCDYYLKLGQDSSHDIIFDYAEWEKSRSQSKKISQKYPAIKKEKKKKKLSYLEQREYDSMENSIRIIEQKMDRCKEKLSDPVLSTESSKLEVIYQEFGDLQNEADKLYQRWAELEDKIDIEK